MSWTLQDEFDEAAGRWAGTEQPNPEHAVRLLQWYADVRRGGPSGDLDLGTSRETNEQYGPVPPIPTAGESGPTR